MPGDTGSCSESVSDTSNGTATQVDAALVIRTISSSGAGTPGSGLGTEAILDGLATGLQVTVTDTSTTPYKTFSLGAVSCYTSSSRRSPALYPNAAYCVSNSGFQKVASNVPNATFNANFVISWSFPLVASNPYQGSGATIQLQSFYRGTTGGSGTLGASTGPNGGALAASTPTTGARLPETLGQLLVGAGALLALMGMFLSMRARRDRPFQPPVAPL
ncbi:MAG: hypothetical protein WA809_10530 [Candidatus Dormiibacterota bacterium]